MVKSMFAGVAGLKAHQQMMDVIGNNIANVNTYGFKGASTAFQDAIYQSVKSSTGGNNASGGYGGQNASQVGYGVTVSGITADFGQGGAAATGRDLDCMISGTGFFIVGTMKGGDEGIELGSGSGEEGGDYDALAANGLQLSRVGRFFVDNNGYLVDGNGNYIYGFAPEDATAISPEFSKDNLAPLRVPEFAEIQGSSTNAATVAGATPSVTNATDRDIVTVNSVAKPGVKGQFSVKLEGLKISAGGATDGTAEFTFGDLTPSLSINVTKDMDTDDIGKALQGQKATVGGVELTAWYDATKKELTFIAPSEQTLDINAVLGTDPVEITYTAGTGGIPDATTPINDATITIIDGEALGTVPQTAGSFVANLAGMAIKAPADGSGGAKAKISFGTGLSIEIDVAGDMDTEAIGTALNGKTLEIDGHAFTAEYNPVTEELTFTNGDNANIDLKSKLNKVSITGISGSKAAPVDDTPKSYIAADGKELFVINSYTIKADGTIVGVTADNVTVTLGQVGLASVTNPNGLTKGSSYYYDLGDNCGAISVVPAGGSTGTLEGSCLEMAKVDLANEFSQLIITQRGFQANSKIITVTDSMLEELVNMKR